MSVEALSLVLHHSRATGTAKLVLLGIANHYGDGGAWPAISTLAKYANATERTVQRAVQELAAAGEVTVEYRQGGYKPTAYQTNRYWLNITCPANCDGSTAHKTRGDIGVVSEVTSTSPLEVTPASPKSSIEPKRTVTFVQHAERQAEFDTFWSVYPRKHGKQAARRAFEKALKDASAEVITDGARRYAEDPNRSEFYTAMPATWLNQGRWEDGPLPERVLTPEEKAARDRAKAEAQRVLTLAENERMREESEKAKAESVPAPKCVHGKSIVSCMPCLRNVGTSD